MIDVGIVVGHDVVQQVPAGGAGRVHTDRTLDLRGVVAGVFERMPGGLQEQPMLRIGHARRLRSEAEEIGVEFVDSIHQCGAPHVGVIRQRLLADALGQQVVFGQRDDRFLAAAQVVPERRHRVGAGQPGRPCRRPQSRWAAVRCCWSHSISYLSPSCGSLPCCGTLLGSITNSVGALAPFLRRQGPVDG